MCVYVCVCTFVCACLRMCVCVCMCVYMCVYVCHPQLFHAIYKYSVRLHYIKLHYISAVPREYCEFEVFHPGCWKGEVIVMRSASYGRMRIGRCVEANLGYLGCSADVLRAADSKCSGRQTCHVPIPDADFDATKPCYKELKMYLDASYSCQKGRLSYCNRKLQAT